MNAIRVRAMARKEFIHILRDWRSLGLALLIPVFMLILFGYALTLDVDNVPLAVWDQDKSAASRDFIRGFSGSRYFRLSGYALRYRDIEDEINENRIYAGLVIPRDFSRLLLSGRPAPVQLILDGSNSNTATMTLGYAQGVVRAYNAYLAQPGAPAPGAIVPGAKEIAPVRVPQRGMRAGVRPYAIDMRPRIWFNPELKSKNYIVPGLMAIIMMVVGCLLPALTVSREWERGTMEQLISTPVKRSEIILGKFVPYFCIGMADVLIAVLMGVFLFAVPLRGSVALLFAFCALFLTGVLAQGMLISIATRNQFLSVQFVFMSTFLPSFLLSGFAFPIANMPAAVQTVTFLVPARYFITVLRGIYLKGVGLEVLWSEALFLAAFAALMLWFSDRKFIKKVA